MAEKIGFWKRHEWILTFLGTILVLGVGTVTGWNSWNHIVHVGQVAGEPGAITLPVAIDGMMLAATVMAAIDRVHGMRTRFWAVIGLWLGSLLTLAFNMISALERGLSGMLIAVLYAVTFLVSVEMVFHPSRTPLEAVKKTVDKVVDSIRSEPLQTSATPVASQTTQDRPFPPRRPDRSRPGDKPWQRKPERAGTNGGQQRPDKQNRPQKPIEVAVLTEQKPETLPLAMEEKASDIVGTDASEAIRSQDKEIKEVV